MILVLCAQMSFLHGFANFTLYDCQLSTNLTLPFISNLGSVFSIVIFLFKICMLE